MTTAIIMRGILFIKWKNYSLVVTVHGSEQLQLNLNLYNGMVYDKHKEMPWGEEELVLPLNDIIAFKPV